MRKKEANRIKFFTRADYACVEHLSLAEPILRNFDKEKSFTDINDIIELYQIKRYIDAELFLPRWTDNDQRFFKEIVKDFWNAIRKYFIIIDDLNFIKLFNSLEFSYRDSFWDLVETFEIHKNISKEKFIEVLKTILR
jgi:hypothetical protein